MQILLAAHETIIKINSKSTKIEYIQQFIDTHCSNIIKNDDSILIPYLAKEHLHRIFLLKWLYGVYIKKTKTEFSNLKDSLILRCKKPIKILFAKNTVFHIRWDIVDNEQVDILVKPSNRQLELSLSGIFGYKLTVLNTHLSLHLKTDQEKEILKRLLNTNKLINEPYLNIYNKKEMYNFISSKKKANKTNVNEAYAIFGLVPKHDIKTIKKRYKQLAMKYHPDRVFDKNTENVTQYTQKFQNILQAYEILLNGI